MKRRFATAAVLTALLVVGGCESTGSIDKKVEPGALKSTGLVLFTVTHDMDKDHPWAANVKLFVQLRDLDKGIDLPRAFSNMETLAPMMSSSFDKVWGRYFVRELPAGHYAFTGWSVEQTVALRIDSYRPKKPVPPLAFEVVAGSVTYVGNVHGRLAWRDVMSLAGAMPEIRNEDKRDLALILTEYPQLQGKVVVSPLRQGSWLPE